MTALVGMCCAFLFDGGGDLGDGVGDHVEGVLGIQISMARNGDPQSTYHMYEYNR
jgi:hypothetical protein